MEEKSKSHLYENLLLCIDMYVHKCTERKLKMKHTNVRIEDKTAYFLFLVTSERS